jgi:predicted NAD/FAD-dependent oxidoreductase
MGQFDRAFPPGPVFGKVRQRSLARHAKRLDMNRYARIVSPPAGGKRLRIGVVGAGLTGLTAARTLADQGHDVVVVEKARGAGGRMSTRRDADLRFDHGAQYFTARDPRFLRHVAAWQERGLVRKWDARIATIGERDISFKGQSAERFVAVPAMNAICIELAGQLADCRFNWTVSELERLDKGWVLTSEQGQTIDCDALVFTTPPGQARTLLADPEVDQLLSGVEMLPCWALMLVLEQPLFAEHDAAFVNQGPFSWVSSQPARPERPGANAWVLHASPQWSSMHLEKSADEVRSLLLEAARELPLSQTFTVTSAVAHRWRYALARQPLSCGAIWLGSKNLVLAGDWCNGSRVEGAFLSGVAAAGRIMAAHYQQA